MAPRRALSALLAVASAAACGGAPTVPSPSPVATVDTVMVTDTLVRIDTVVVAGAPDDDLRSQVARLRMQLLERDARVSELEGQLDAERSEVVSTMAKLQSQASRAQAASEMAEAEIALGALARMPAGSDSGEHLAGTELLSRAGEAFGRTNYDGAIYLAGRARALATQGAARLQTGAGRDAREGEAHFGVPVLLTVNQRSNLREGPATSFRIRSVLDEGTIVTGFSYTDEWVYVIVPGGEEGWIFHTLVRGGR